MLPRYKDRRGNTVDVQQRIYPAIHMVFRSFSGPVDDIVAAVRALIEAVQAAGETPLGPPVVLYANAGQDPQAVVARICVPVPTRFQGFGDLRTLTIEAVEVAVARHVGPHAEIGQAYEAISAWVDEQGCSLAEGASETFVVGPHTDSPPECWQTDVAVRLKPR